MAGNGVDAMWLLPSALNVKVKIFNQARVNEDDQSCAFCETVLKCPKSHSIQQAGSHFWQAPNLQQYERWSVVWMSINRVTLQHNREFIMLIFLFSGFITMCNLKKRLIRTAFWVHLQAMFMNDWEQTERRLKFQERLLTKNKRKVMRWNIYRSLQRQ